MTHLAGGAPIVICGAISQYNNTNPVKGPTNYLSLLVQRATMTDIVVSDYYDRAGEAAMVIAGIRQCPFSLRCCRPDEDVESCVASGSDLFFSACGERPLPILPRGGYGSIAASERFSRKPNQEDAEQCIQPQCL